MATVHSPGPDRNHRFRIPLYVAGSFISHNAPYRGNVVFVDTSTVSLDSVHSIHIMGSR